MHAMLSPEVELNLGLSSRREAMSQTSSVVEVRRLNIINKKDKMSCNQSHARHFDESTLADLEEHQMHAKGEKKCCQCAYNSGYKQGALLQTFISLDIESLGNSNTSANGRYKSIHQAFALGYSDGVNSFVRS